MSTIKRGLIYLLRKRSRSILLLAITFIMAVFAMLGFAIMSSANNERDALLRSLASGFELEANLDNRGLFENVGDDDNPNYMYTGELIMQETIDAIMGLESVTDYFVCDYARYMWVNMELRPGLNAGHSIYYQHNPEYLNQPPLYHTLDFFIVSKQVTDFYGCTETKKHEHFRNGALTLAAGRHIERDDKHKAMISTYLAELNGLAVGDTIRAEAREGLHKSEDFYGPVYDILGQPVEFEIVGIFDVNFYQETRGEMEDYGEVWIEQLEFELAENLIFCDISSVTEILEMLFHNGVEISYSGDGTTDDINRYDSVTFFVDDPKEIMPAITEAKEIGNFNPVYFSITPDDSTYRTSEQPLKYLTNISLLFMIIIVGACIGLIILVLNMWTKSRKREMGIYMSLGLSKKAIIGQLILECVITSIIALILAFIVSSVLAGPVGSVMENMTSPEISEESYTVERSIDFMPIISKALAEPVNLQYGLSASNILIVALIIFGSIIVSVLFSARKIMALKPKSVLSTL